MYGLGLGILAGWIGARSLGAGIAIWLVGVCAGLALSSGIASSFQERIDPLIAGMTVFGALISGLITWKLRTDYLKKRDEL